MKHNLFLFFRIVFVVFCSVQVNGQIVTTIGGCDTIGYNHDGRPATTAALNTPTSIARDGAGNIYFSDQLNFRVRKINALTGIITTVAGNGILGNIGDGGPATDAELNKC